MMEKIKVLTVCRGGHCRSVSLKYCLTYRLSEKYDVLACGWESNSEETRKMLYEWADYIVIMHKDFEQYVPEEYKDHPNGDRKLYCYHVGEDRWCNPFHPELQELIASIVGRHGLFVGDTAKPYPK